MTPIESELKILNEVAKKSIRGDININTPSNDNKKNYIRGNVDLVSTNCKNCHKEIIKNNGMQIVFFCSPSCRRNFKER